MKIWNNVLKFNCLYEQNGTIDEHFNWDGYVITKFIDNDYHGGIGAAYDIEGVIVDHQLAFYPIVPCCKIEDERFLVGHQGILQPEGVIEFSIFPNGTSSPIDYEFRYDEEDDCLYGVYYFVKNGLENNHYDGFAKLTIEQELHVDKSYVEEQIENNDAFWKYNKIIDNLANYKMANYQLHNGNKDRFLKAKKYFRNNQYTLSLSNKSNN